VVRAVEIDGAAHLVLTDGVVPLHPEEALFDAMPLGWRRQQRSRLLSLGTVKNRDSIVKRFHSFTNTFPWQWNPSDLEDWISHLLSGTCPLAHSTIRNYQNELAMFCTYLTDPHYGWIEQSEQRFEGRRTRGGTTEHIQTGHDRSTSTSPAESAHSTSILARTAIAPYFRWPASFRSSSVGQLLELHPVTAARWAESSGGNWARQRHPARPPQPSTLTSWDGMNRQPQPLPALADQPSAGPLSLDQPRSMSRAARTGRRGMALRDSKVATQLPAPARSASWTMHQTCSSRISAGSSWLSAPVGCAHSSQYGTETISYGDGNTRRPGRGPSTQATGQGNHDNAP
jgi:hypothetical protein